MKLCEISVSFIYTIPFITEDDRRRIAEKDPNSYKLNLYKKSVKNKYIQAFMFSTLLIVFLLVDFGIVFMIIFLNKQSTLQKCCLMHFFLALA